MPVVVTPDVHPGQLALDDALAAVEQAASAEWLAAARQALADLIAQGRPFSSDDLWARLDGSPREPRALGPLIRSAARAGAIQPSGRWLLTDRAQAHRRPVREWLPVANGVAA